MLLKAKLSDHSIILINENEVCSIEKGEGNVAIITMSNSKVYMVVSPSYDNWENDVLIRPE